MEKLSIKKAAIINIIAKYSNVLVGLVFSAILARILTPNDYGIVAVVAVFTTLFTILADMGIGAAIVQNKELNNDDENVIFSFSIVLAIVLAMIFAILAIPIAIFYSNNAYLSICPILSISIFFNTVNMVPNAKLLKDKKFLLIGIRTLVVTIVTYIIALVCAVIGFKYYTIILQSVMSAILIFVWNFHGSGLRVCKIRMDSINKIKSFFAYQFAYDVINYFSRNIDNLLIGKFMGAKKLAYYDKGYKMMLYPINNLTYAITPVLHPILSDYQNDKKYIYTEYLKVAKILSLLGVYVTTFCFFSSKEIILIMFGNQWVGAIKCFQILSVSVWCQMVSTTSTSICKSLGRTDVMFKGGVIHITLSIVLIVIGVCTGSIEKTAMFVAAGLIMRFFIECYFLIKKAFGFSILKFYKNFIPDIIIFVILIIAFRIINIISFNNILISFVYKFATSFVIMIIALVLTKQMRFLLLLFPKKIVEKFSKK